MPELPLHQVNVIALFYLGVSLYVSNDSSVVDVVRASKSDSLTRSNCASPSFLPSRSALREPGIGRLVQSEWKTMTHHGGRSACGCRSYVLCNIALFPWRNWKDEKAVDHACRRDLCDRIGGQLRQRRLLRCSQLSRLWWMRDNCR